MTVEEAEVLRRNELLRGIPGWRKPLGVCPGGGRERDSLGDVLRELAADRPQTFDELLAQVREDWGPCKPKRLRAVLDDLVGARIIRRRGDRYRTAGGAR